MTEVAKSAQTALTITREQTSFTPEQEQALMHHAGVSPNSKPADVEVFFHQCKRTGLDPFAKQIYMIERQGKQTIQTGIDGFRLISRRAVDATGETLGYEDNLWCDQSGTWRDIPKPGETPLAAKVTVIRNGQRFPAIALFDEYAATKRDGSLMAMWKDRPAGQLAKCAEALALRKAFPQDLSGLYTADEMQQADNSAAPAPAAQPAPATPAAQPEGDPLADRIDKAIASQDAAQVAAFGKFLANSHPDHPRLAEVRGHYQDLTAQTTDEAPQEATQEPLDAEIIEEPAHA